MDGPRRRLRLRALRLPAPVTEPEELDGCCRAVLACRSVRPHRTLSGTPDARDDAPLARAVRPRSPPVVIGRLARRRAHRASRSACRAKFVGRGEATSRASFLPGDAESTQGARGHQAPDQDGEQAADGDRLPARRAASPPPTARADRRATRALNALDQLAARSARADARSASAQCRAIAPPRWSWRSITRRTARRRRSLDPVEGRTGSIVGTGDGRAEVKVTGPAGYSADAIKVFEQINGTLLGAAVAARLRAADPHLPQPDLLARSRCSPWCSREVAARGIGYALDRGRRDGQRAVLVDPVGPRARGGNRLRAAARRPLPRGAAQPRGQARGDGACAAPAPGPAIVASG